MTAVFAEVAVTRNAPGRYHYRVPAHLLASAVEGARVLVVFGKSGDKITGVITRLMVEPPPAGVEIKDISVVLDESPSLSRELLDLCAWVADYYEAARGEVIKAALPAGTGVAEKQVYVLTDAGRAALGLGAMNADTAGALPGKQRVVLARLADGALAVAGLPAATRAIATALETAGLVEKIDRRNTRVRAKREKVVELLAPAAVMRELAAGGDAKAGDAKAGDARAGDARAGDAKAGDGRAGDATAGDARAGDAKPRSSKAGGDAKVKRVNPVRLAVIDALADGPVALATLEERVPKARAVLKDFIKLGQARLFDREVSTIAEVGGVGIDEPVAPPALTHEQLAAVAAILAAAPASDVARAESAASIPASASASMPASVSASASASVPASDVLPGLPTPSTSAAQPAAPKWTPFLLHGVTGSGKTEVYLRVIAEVLERGKTALVLVPEISLTPQLAARFRARFGNLVAILHSGLSPQARMGEWSRLHRGEATIAVGARSAVFAPLANLGAIVVDEEHDGSFKQDEGVKYHARDVALVRAQRAGALCILGSATPSLESHAHALAGTYHRLVLAQRPTARPMPAVEIVDLKQHIVDPDSLLTAPLRDAITETLAAGDQAILFLNRRGFATYILCMACGTSLRCVHCSVALTYHRGADHLRCHYCNFTNAVPDICGKCGSVGAIQKKGIGTERVADAIIAQFPTARIARLDRDVASGADVEPILAKVGRRQVDILIGTQMVTKGHDFPGVTLVGVLCADTGLNMPDFRAAERTFQLLSQVAGRAGRGDRKGRVLIQTYRPDSPAVVAAAAHDYAMFATTEIAARAELRYPPHGRLIAVRVDGPTAAEHAVAGLAQELSAIAMRAADGTGVDVVGPVAAPIARLRGRVRWQIWLRGTDRHALRRVARAVAASSPDGGSNLRVALDVDPISTM